MKRLVIDIETRPSLAYVWGIWNENIGTSQIVAPTEMLCFAAKWIGKNKIFYSSVNDGEGEMVKRAWELLDEADAVIHYNGRSFDIPHLNREFLQAGMTPPAPYQQIDLLKAVKKRFRFPSNKLEYIAGALGIGEKLKHEGFELWKRCLAGEASAWKLMRQYNVNDVALTEELYERIRPWIPNHPSFAAMTGEHVCPTCGSKELESRGKGWSYTQQSSYRRFRCKECGKWSRATKAETTVKIREIAE